MPSNSLNVTQVNLDISILQVANNNIILAEDSPQQEDNHTIGSVLAVPTPYLDPSKGRLDRPQPSIFWVDVCPEHIRPWGQFNMQTLNAAFGNLLGIPAVLDNRQIHFQMENVGSIKDFLVDYLNPLLQSPLAEGSRALVAQLGLPPAAVSIRHHRRVSRFQPSISFIWETNPSAALAHGAARRSRVWSSGNIGDDADSFWPFHHIATFARHDQTRYTFVVTEDEVVVARIFDTNHDQNTYGVEWRAIPWNVSGEGNLTASLAIWSLAMMGLNEDHRGVVLQDEMRPLNGWWQRQDAQGRAVFVHHISGRQLPELPHGSQVIW